MTIRSLPDLLIIETRTNKSEALPGILYIETAPAGGGGGGGSVTVFWADGISSGLWGTLFRGMWGG